MSRLLPLVLLPLLFSCQPEGVSIDEGAEPSQCDDGEDNDGDGFTDCTDQGCWGTSACIEGDESGDCGDGLDNDQDGWVDCDDQDCWGLEGCAEGETDADADADADTDTDSDADADTDVDILVYVNELLASNSSTNADEGGGYDDWFELYNASDVGVSLDGWAVAEDEDEPDACPLQDGLSIPAGGWLLLWADGDTDAGADHVCFTLTRAGDSVYLFDADGELMDGVEFEDQETDVSLARFADGEDNWQQDPTPTPGERNQ